MPSEGRKNILATFQTLQSSFTFGPVKDPKQQHTNWQTNKQTDWQTKTISPNKSLRKAATAAGKLVKKMKLFWFIYFCKRECELQKLRKS